MQSSAGDYRITSNNKPAMVFGVNTQEFSRLERVAASIKRALGQPLNNVARELNVGLLTLTAVEVAPDLRRATAFISPLADDVDEAALLEGLNERAGELQREMSSQLRMKRTPVLSFSIDRGIAQSARITQLLDPDSN